jgi:CopG family transcriptional regulator / antitoxin EndoAI
MTNYYLLLQFIKGRWTGMARTSKVLTVSLPQEMFRQAEKIAKDENRTRSELFREALRQYIASRERWQEIRRWGREAARERGLTSEADVERLIDELRAGRK